jgi:uncharacterized membrane protein
MLDDLDKRTARHLGFLALFTVYCVSLVGLRFIWTGQSTFPYLIWNLFLAWMPILFSSLAQYWGRRPQQTFLAIAACIPWLLFLPNAPYIVTDLVHLRPRAGVPYWYDILLMASFAFHGLVLGFFSMGQIHRLLNTRLRPIWAWTVMILSSIGAAYGIYLGRVLRWNSWDILRHPLRIAVDSLRPFLDPFAHKEAVVMTVVLSVFLFGGYLIMRAGAQERA